MVFFANGKILGDFNINNEDDLAEIRKAVERGLITLEYATEFVTAKYNDNAKEQKLKKLREEIVENNMNITALNLKASSLREKRDSIKPYATSLKSAIDNAQSTIHQPSYTVNYEITEDVDYSEDITKYLQEYFSDNRNVLCEAKSYLDILVKLGEYDSYHLNEWCITKEISYDDYHLRGPLKEKVFEHKWKATVKATCIKMINRSFTTAEDMANWLTSRISRFKYVNINEADEFFNGELMRLLNSELSEYIDALDPIESEIEELENEIERLEEENVKINKSIQES